MTNYSKQPKNLKRVNVNGMYIYFAMDVSKKRMHELFSNPEFEYHKCYKGYISTVTIESNSVWYSKEGDCIISNED